MTELDLQLSTPDPTTRDTWRCLKCDYSLRGTIEPRCPECGTAFDPAEMNRRARGLPVAATTWERKPSFGTFLSTWFSVIRRPLKFAANAPKRNFRKSALCYSAICYAIAAIVPALFIAMANNQFSFFFAYWLASFLVVGITAMLCELLISFISRDPDRMWTITSYQSSYLPLSALTFLLLQRFAYIPVALLAWWWFYVVVVSLLTVDGGGLRSALKCLWIPLIVMASVWIGGMATLGVGTVLARFGLIQ